MANEDRTPAVPVPAYAVAHLRELQAGPEITLIVLGFPDRDRAAAWYASDAYQEILPLRTRNAISTAVLIDGVPLDHRATAVLGAPAG